MSEDVSLGRAGAAWAELLQELERCQQSGRFSVHLYNIVQIGDHPGPPDQAERLAKAFQDALSGASVKLEISDARQRGGAQSPPPRDGVFRFDGCEAWEIGFAGKVHRHRDAVGLHQLLLLLKRPKERVEVFELAGLREQKAELQQASPQDIADSPALAQYKAEIDRLRDELTIARDAHDTEREGQVEVEMETLLAHVNGARSLHGARRLGDPRDRLRKRVRSTMRSSLQKIIARSPDLGEHLTASIKLGYDCGYFPATPVRWAF